jgi:CRISPR-associated protein Csd1
MTAPVSGLLPALVGYYRRLENDPDRPVADFGFSVEKLHFQIVLEADGSLSSFDDIRVRSDRGKPIPRPLLVPDGGGRSGTGMKPFFCWDNTGYALGRDNKGKPDRAAQMLGAFRDLHRSFLPELAGDDGFAALCRFLDRWEPAEAESLPSWGEAAGLNVVFRLRAREAYVHQSEAVRAAWSRHLARQNEGEPGPRGISLVSGREEELARLHPQIRGVSGANTTGAAIVSFNLDAFESYGKSQGYNAPVGTRDAFRYTTALNRLLADDARRVHIGDATVVFWSDRAEGADAEVLFREMFGDAPPRGEEAEHAATLARVKGFLDAAREGRLADRVQAPDAPFYVLGLSPNASRLNVRYWLVGTVSQFAERLAAHVGQLEMTGARPDDPPLGIRRLLLETAREPKDVAPQLAGEVARAVLGGWPYPQALFNAVLGRVRADSNMNHRRAAMLKAHLIRNRHEEVPVALNTDHPDEAYHFGRLFAVLEFAQTNALGEINRSVKDAYFSTAAATPAIVFPRLMQLHHHHVEKLPTNAEAARREKKRTRGFFERLVQEIYSHFRHFPPHMPLEKQGLFYIGYYHQRQDFFTKRTDSGQETSDE